MKRTIINNVTLDNLVSGDLYVAKFVHDDMDETIKTLETWDANNSLDELLTPVSEIPTGLAHSATHLLQIDGVTLYMHVSESEIIINHIDKEIPHVAAA